MMRTTDLRGENVIDSRDVIARFDELNSDRDLLQDDIDNAQDALDALDQNDADERPQWEAAHDALAEAQQALANWEDAEEWKDLKELIDQAEGCADWKYGEALIVDRYFTQYAQELADDIGAIDRNASWPMTCIDWEQAAEELQQDYTSVEFAGETYWIRS